MPHPKNSTCLDRPMGPNCLKTFKTEQGLTVHYGMNHQNTNTSTTVSRPTGALSEDVRLTGIPPDVNTISRESAIHLVLSSMPSNCPSQEPSELDHPGGYSDLSGSEDSISSDHEDDSSDCDTSFEGSEDNASSNHEGASSDCDTHSEALTELPDSEINADHTMQLPDIL